MRISRLLIGATAMVTALSLATPAAATGSGQLAGSVGLWEHANYGGGGYILPADHGKCENLPAWLKNQASSADISGNTFVGLYTDDNCASFMGQIGPRDEPLFEVRFNDRVNSVRVYAG